MRMQRKTAVPFTAALFGVTLLAILGYPSIRTAFSAPATSSPNLQPANPTSTALVDTRQHPVIEAVFVLDTTGSMGGLIQAAKDKIWSIASTMAAAEPAPEIRIGLVAYRDRGDDYVTRVVTLSPDLDAIHAELMQFQANGGGDGPESVNQALHDALHSIQWSQDGSAYQVIFLVGDAPAHMDYDNDIPYPQTLTLAKKRGIHVNVIQCGSQQNTTSQWQRIAQLGGGGYFQVEQNGSAVAVATPYDGELAKLSAKLDDTRLYYGKTQERAAKRDKLAAEKRAKVASSPAAMARRADFVTSKSGKASLIGEHELVDEVASGRLELETLPAEELPAPLAGLDKTEQRALIEKKAQEREELSAQIQALSRQRTEYLESKVAENGDAEDSLDHKIFTAVREQAAGKGLTYEGSAPAY
jgi:Mg-chelatase subunit ChlD